MVSDDDLILGKDIQFNQSKLDFVVTAGGDLEVERYDKNLAQALWHRLSTKKGELPLHPFYGSEIHIMVGEINNEDNREKIRLLVAECVEQDPRVESIKDIQIKADDKNIHLVKIYVSVIPIKYRKIDVPTGDVIELNLIYSFYLDSGVIEF